jgi:hypothetical protein
VSRYQGVRAHLPMHCSASRLLSRTTTATATVTTAKAQATAAAAAAATATHPRGPKGVEGGLCCREEASQVMRGQDRQRAALQHSSLLSWVRGGA